MTKSIKLLAKAAKLRISTGAAASDKGTLPAIAREEERIYQIVCRLQEEEQTVIDPIRQIADPKRWQNSQGIERERYVLVLSDMYLRAVDRYRRAQAKLDR